MSLHAVALRFPFTLTKGPSPNHEKQPRPLSFHPQTLQLALCIGAGSVLLASTKPRFVCRTARWQSVIHHSRERVSTAPESNFTPLQPTLGIEHGDLRLVCGCSAMETHSMKLLTNSSCAEVASRGSLELSSECCNRGQRIFRRYMLQHLPVPFGELVWPTTRG